MDPFHFACPHCSSRLRVREKLYVGRQVDCPECGDTLLIVDRAGELAVERVERMPPAVPADGTSVPAGHETAAAKRTGGASGQREAATTKSPATSGAASASALVTPAQNVAHRILIDRRRLGVALGALAALIVLALAINHFARSPGGPDKSVPEIASELGAPGAMNRDNEEQSAPADGQGKQSPDNDDENDVDAHLAKGADAASSDSDGGSATDDAPPTVEGAVDVGGVADERPIEPEFAPEPPDEPVRKIDLAVSLKQPIARFDQPRSKPLEEIVVSVAEMAGARVTVDRAELGPAAARLAEPMALKLENTTVGEILSGLLRPAGLSYRIEGDHLRVVRADE